MLLASTIFTCRLPWQVSRAFGRRILTPLGSLARGRLWYSQSSQSWRLAPPSLCWPLSLCSSISIRCSGRRSLPASQFILASCGHEPMVSHVLPGDQQDTSKTGTQDDTGEIGVGRRAWPRGVCSSLHSRSGRAGSLFGLSLPKLQRYFAAGFKAAGLGSLTYTPHCLGHGGASTDAADGLTASAVQLCGQWMDARSGALLSNRLALDESAGLPQKTLRGRFVGGGKVRL